VIVDARPAVRSVHFDPKQLNDIKTEPVTPKAPEASKGVQPVYCPSESLPKDIEDLAVTDPQLCPWCSQPCRDPVQVGECDGPPVEYCEEGAATWQGGHLAVSLLLGNIPCERNIPIGSYPAIAGGTFHLPAEYKRDVSGPLSV